MTQKRKLIEVAVPLEAIKRLEDATQDTHLLGKPHGKVGVPRNSSPTQLTCPQLE